MGSRYTSFSCKILLLQLPPSCQRTCYAYQPGHAVPLPLPGSEGRRFAFLSPVYRHGDCTSAETQLLDTESPVPPKGKSQQRARPHTCPGLSLGEGRV